MLLVRVLSVSRSLILSFLAPSASLLLTLNPTIKNTISAALRRVKSFGFDSPGRQLNDSTVDVRFCEGASAPACSDRA